MFIFDVETLGKESTAAILSIACIHFDDSGETPSDMVLRYRELLGSAFFVKLDAADQIKRLNRSMTRSSLDWWSKQCENAKVKSFLPNKSVDIKIEDGIEKLRSWAKQFPDKKEWVWARGNLDQLVIDSYEEKLGIEPVFHFSRWRDVRTAVDFLTGSDNGYCNIPRFDPQAHVIKHDPVHDCAYDAMMLLYGEK